MQLKIFINLLYFKGGNNMKYNTGIPLSFETIKMNREIAVKEIAEGNKGLENLLNTCIDRNIPTHASCGHASYITFLINDDTKDMLFSLCRLVSSVEKYYNSFRVDISYTSDGIGKCSFYFLENNYGIDTSSIFNIIDTYIKNYYKTHDFEYKEFEYVYSLEKMISDMMGLDSSVEILRMKKASEEIVKEPEYIITIEQDIDGIPDKKLKKSLVNIVKIVSDKFPEMELAEDPLNIYALNIRKFEIKNFKELESMVNGTNKVKKRRK